MRHAHDVHEAQVPAGAARVPAGIRVLLGSASDQFSTSFRSRLEQQGCVVQEATTGEDVLRLAREHFDVIFLELEAPAIYGLAVLLELKSSVEPVECPIVLIKGEDEPAHIVQRGLDLGASGYLIWTRVTSTMSTVALFDGFGVETDPVPAKAAPVLRLHRVGSDRCPYSSRGTFHDCPAFVPINPLAHADGGPGRISCSHLRAGQAGGWRLYPRCAIGDPAARAKYVRDQTS